VSVSALVYSSFYFKLPYIGHLYVVTQKKICHFIKRYCNNLDIKLVSPSFKIGTMFGVKDPIPGRLRSRMPYKFARAGCNACYVGETTRHFSTRVHVNLRLRSFGVIRIRISDPRSFWIMYFKGTGESTLAMNSPVPLMHHDPDRSWITDPEPDHPKGTQPKTILTVFTLSRFTM